MLCLHGSPSWPTFPYCHDPTKHTWSWCCKGKPSTSSNCTSVWLAHLWSSRVHHSAPRRATTAPGLCFTGTVQSPAVILSERSCHAQSKALSSPGNLLFSPIFFNGLWKKHCCGFEEHFSDAGVRVHHTLKVAAYPAKDLITKQCWYGLHREPLVQHDHLFGASSRNKYLCCTRRLWAKIT